MRESTETISSFGAISVVVLVLSGLVAGVFYVAGGYLGAIVTQTIARAFGGEGDTTKLLYAQSAYQTPGSIISSILTMFQQVPLYYFSLVTLLSIYWLILNVMAVKAVNGFGWAEGYCIRPGCALRNVFPPRCWHGVGAHQPVKSLTEI
jgi:hypothetical protein